MKNNILLNEIVRRVKQSPMIGTTIARSCEYFMRKRGGQLEYARECEEHIVDRKFEGKLHTGANDDYTQEGWEIGELLRCLAEYGECEHAPECWVTRRGFCKKLRERITTNEKA